MVTTKSHPATNSSNIIELNQVKFAYPQSKNDWVVDIDHWTLVAGEHTLLVGPSGSGKSTALNLISGLLQAKQGEITVLGEHLHQMNASARDRFRAQHMGYVFQQFNLIPYLNAIENIELAACFAPKPKAPKPIAPKPKAPKSIAPNPIDRPDSPRMSTQDRAKTLLSELKVQQQDWHKPTAWLSLGQQQRVAIARALMNQPQLLIADEPTSALDQDNRDRFMSLLLDTSQSYQMTLLCVSHDRSLSQFIQRTVHFDRINASPKPRTSEGS